MSLSSIDCRPYGKRVSRTGNPPKIAGTSLLTGATVMSFPLGWSAQLFFLWPGDDQRGGIVDEFIQCLGAQPLRIVVAGIAESVGKRPRLLPVLLSPPGMSRLDHVHVIDFERMASFVFR